MCITEEIKVQIVLQVIAVGKGGLAYLTLQFLVRCISFLERMQWDGMGQAPNPGEIVLTLGLFSKK